MSVNGWMVIQMTCVWSNCHSAVHTQTQTQTEAYRMHNNGRSLTIVSFKRAKQQSGDYIWRDFDELWSGRWVGASGWLTQMWVDSWIWPWAWMINPRSSGDRPPTHVPFPFQSYTVYFPPELRNNHTSFKLIQNISDAPVTRSDSWNWSKTSPTQVRFKSKFHI